MPLVKSTLQQALVQMEPTDNVAAAAGEWANAINTYASSILPLSITSQVALGTLQTTLLGIGAPGAFNIILPQALTAYATTLGLGMAPAFTATPPPSPPIITPALQLGQNGGTKQQVMQSFANIIHAWFRTGIAVNSTTGVPVNWL